MGKKLIPLVIIVGLLALGAWYVFFNKSTTPLTNPLSQSPKQVLPSETLIDYIDPSGFSFSYPDNLSLAKNELDDSTYGDLQLSSKDVSGSLSLKIVDSKFKTLDDWVKQNQKASTAEPKDVNLGNLKAKEIITSDRILMGALDQGIFFSIEMPKIEENFWNKVYAKVTSTFSFVSPTSASTGGSSTSDVSFEGEEVVQ